MHEFYVSFLRASFVSTSRLAINKGNAYKMFEVFHRSFMLLLNMLYAQTATFLIILCFFSLNSIIIIVATFL